MHSKAAAIFPLIILSLLTAIWTGWIRIGGPLPLSPISAQHGALMTGSFLTTVILLERAVTFKNKYVLLLPLLNGLSSVFFLTDKAVIGQSFLLIASIGFCGMIINFIYRFKELYYYLFFVGAFCLTMGNLLLIKSQFYPVAVPWWIGYLLFTIVAERLELSRFLQLTKLQNNLLFVCLAITLTGLFLPFHSYGSTVFAVGLFLTALWLLRFDMAIKSLKRPGQHRYSAILLIAGYVWLVVTAVLMIAGNVNAFWYDATLHSFFIGFVFSMIFSHAPIILPAVLKMSIKLYRPQLYIVYVLMQFSLIIRIVADVVLVPGLRKWAGMMNGIFILLFFVIMAVLIRIELKKNIQG